MTGQKVTFLAHFTNFKFLKSTGTWRVELDLFEKDRGQVPIHSTFLEKVLEVTYSEYNPENPGVPKIEDVLNDSNLQLALDTSNPEETKAEIEKRTGIDFNLTPPDEQDKIILMIKESLK